MKRTRKTGGTIQDVMKDAIISNSNNEDKTLPTNYPDHVYYNIAITNTNQSETLRASYNQSLTTPVIKNPSEYYCSIQRFTVPLQDVPIFVFLDSTYSVTISYNSNDYKKELIYVPSYTNNINLISPNDRFVYSYNQFIDSINNGLGDAMADFTAALPIYNGATTYNAGQAVRYDLSGVYVAYSCLYDSTTGHQPNLSPDYWSPIATPYMEYDPTSQLIALVASRSYHNLNFEDVDQPLKIWFNTALWNFFTNFERIYNGTIPSVYNQNGKNYNIIIKPTGLNFDIIPAIFEDFGIDVESYKVYQEFVSLYDWNSLRNIVFFTSSIPIRSEGIPANIFAPWNSSTTYNSGDRVSFSNSTYSSISSGNVGNQPDISPTYWSIVSNIGSSSAYQPILTDFQLSVTNGPEARSYAQYVPTSEYRLIDLTGNTPLNNIDIQVYWQDKYRVLYPLYINPLDSLDMKILFRKKSVKNNISYYN